MRRLEIYEFCGAFLVFVLARASTSYFSAAGPYQSVIPFYCHALTLIGWTVLLWVMLWRDRTWVPPIPKGIQAWAVEILLGVMIFGVMYTSGIGLLRFLAWIGLENNWHERKEFYDFLRAAGAWGRFSHNTYALASSLFEETYFRIYLLHRLGKYFRSGLWPVVLSAFMFSVVHGYHLPGAIVVFYDGLLLGVIYRVSPRFPKLWVAHWLLDVG